MAPSRRRRFFLIAALVAIANRLVRTNGMKVFIAGLFTVVALVVFIVQGQVVWLLGAVIVRG